MDRFPQFPPPPDDYATESHGEILAFWLLLLACMLLCATAFAAIGYWIAGVAPHAGVYIHGMLLGILIGIAMVASLIRSHARTNNRRTGR